jgi:hypothetical protein
MYKLRKKIVDDQKFNDTVKSLIPYQNHRDKILENIRNGVMSFDFPYDDPSMLDMIFTMNLHFYGFKLKDGYIDGIFLKQDYQLHFMSPMVIKRTFLIYYLKKYYIIDEKIIEKKNTHLDVKEISYEDAKKCIEENPGLTSEGYRKDWSSKKY